MDGTTNLEGFKKSWPCLKLIFSCSKEAIHFQFSFLPMHPSCQKSSVNCSLRSFEGRWLACVPDEDRFWFRYCNTLLFVSLLWHFYETCHAKTLNFLIMWKKLVNSKDLHEKKWSKLFILSQRWCLPKGSSSCQTGLIFTFSILFCCVKITHSCNHIVDIIISSEQHASMHSSGASRWWWWCGWG